MLELLHCGIVALNGTTIGLLVAEAKRTDNAPDMHLAERHSEHALDK